MGTIVARKRKDGTTAYMAKIILKRDGKIIHRETETFDRRPAAAGWIARREEELTKPGGIERAKPSGIRLRDSIDLYIKESVKEIGRTKAQVLAAIKGYEIAGILCEGIDSSSIVTLARQLSKGRKPQTVANYLSHLSAVFAIAGPAWNHRLDAKAMDDALIVCRRLGLVRKSDERDRRPTLDELEKLMAHFHRQSKRYPRSCPMHKIVAFAIFSTRRQEEISTIAWADYEPHHSRILVRDMKDPEDKIGNNMWLDLPPQAMRIIDSMPRYDAKIVPAPIAKRIFPYTTKAIGAAFTRACQFLEIDDLHFHDLRHDGISRLFEMGKSIPQAASVSGHRSWKSLQRYTHLRQTGDKYANWKWLDIIAPPDTRSAADDTAPSPTPAAAMTD